MTPDDPHLIKFFIYLKNNVGIPLRDEEYGLLIKVWNQETLRPQGYLELKELCQQLWGKSKKEQNKIKEAFESFLKLEVVQEVTKQVVQKESFKNKQNLSKPSPTSISPITETQSNFVVDESIKIDVGTAVPQQTTPKRKTADQEYILNDEYFPLNRDQLSKSWALLREDKRKGNETEFDINATIKRFCQEDILEIVYCQERHNQVELLLLIDQSDSMTPFYLLIERLIETARSSQTFKSINIFHFRNSPKETLYTDPELFNQLPINEIISTLHPRRTRVLIVSDAGADKPLISKVRLELTEKFFKQINASFRHIVWLNPFPKKYWSGNTAIKISQLFLMFPFSLSGWRELIQTLQGQIVSEANFSEPPLEIEPDRKSLDALQEVLEIERDKEQYEEAIENLEDFANDFPRYLTLAYHAAFPLAITPHLLYYLQENFLPDLPWIAIPDLLLSPLCESMGGKLYQMDSATRHLLLKALKIRFEKPRFKELSDALLFYLQQGLESTNIEAADLGENPEWIALAYTEPNQLAKQLALKLQQSFGGENADKIKSASLTATFAEPLAEEKFEPLLKLAQGLARQARGYEAGAQEIYNQLPAEVEVAGVLLKIPGRSKLKTFSFDVVTVDKQGREINREKKQARYFAEDLGGVSLQMAQIPGGSFLMGSPEGEGHEDERPQHEVTLKPFFMGKYPITQAQWQTVARLPKIGRDLKPDPSRFKGKDRPVERVSWYDAVEFCQRLSKHTGKEYRLPSEAEWEYACRAGTTTPFHFGETITSNLANYRGTETYAEEAKGTYREETNPVGSFQVANDFGLYDMHGNVWEWCADTWHDSYEGAPKDGSAWLDDNDNHSRRSLRGGSWYNNPNYCRSAYRNNYLSADVISLNLGFRVACGTARTF